MGYETRERNVLELVTVHNALVDDVDRGIKAVVTLVPRVFPCRQMDERKALGTRLIWSFNVTALC